MLSIILLLGLINLGTYARQFKIPEVQEVVQEVLIEFAETVHYSPNTTSVLHARQATPYWYESITHQGISAFGPSGYKVYRNVRDYGAKGDGVTDDTAAINAAMSDGGRCGRGCASSTVTPAVIYFPSGTYILSSSIVDFYYTQIIGNPNSPPVLKATANFQGFGFIDGDPYDTQDLRWGSTNVFFRQIRNLVFDYSNVPIGSSLCGIHWPTSQTTSLQNLVFQMSSASGTQHIGIFSESGSAGFMNDLTFNGGNIGLQIGNQQFTMRGLTFNNVVTAVSQLWSWGWVYQGIKINNCGTGIDISAGGRTAQNVGSVILMDSTITNTPVGIITAFDATSSPTAAGSLILENVVLNNVATAVQKSGGGVLLVGGSTTIAAWGEGNKYTSDAVGPQRFQGPFTPLSRPGSLLSGSVYYSRSKPQYNDLPVSSFQSVRSAGASGNGVADDTTALQNVINSATAAGKIVYFDSGTYRITSTLTIPPGAKLVGETFPIIMSSGSFFNDMNNPKPVVKVGNTGQAGQVEWSDMIVSTQGVQAGAIAIQWNLATSGTPSGMWDVHVRIGGFAGSNLQVSNCPKTPGNPAVNSACIAAFMSMHITASASNLYMENVWMWTADHDIDSSDNTQITVYTGRGLYIESTAGNFWLVGTSVEHHTLYQYQLANTNNLYMGFIQTETPYYQPTPSAPTPFNVVSSLNDPNFATSCAGKSGNCANAWGLRIINSNNVLIYGAGLYSFFNDYSTTCSNGGGPENCQNNIFSVEGSANNLNVYCLSTVGTTNMITQNGNTIASYIDNISVYPDTIALFRPGSSGTTSSSSSSSSSTRASSSSNSQASSSLSCPTGCVPQSSTSSTRILTTPTSVSSSTTSQTSSSAASSSTVSAPAGWTYKGCYTDSVTARTLNTRLDVAGGDSANTPEACIAVCSAQGFTISGVEYGTECYCDTTLRNGGGPAPDGSVGCNMACPGNSAKICGGGNRLSLYMKN